jgi:hypothetical protein
LDIGIVSIHGWCTCPVQRSGSQMCFHLQELHEARAAHKEALARAERAERLVAEMKRGGSRAEGGAEGGEQQHQGGETARDGEKDEDGEGGGGGVCVRTKHALISSGIVALMTEAASCWFGGSLSLRMR